MNPEVFAGKCMLVAVATNSSVTSWGRTIKRNDSPAVNGAELSFHLMWLGMDLVPDFLTNKGPWTPGMKAAYEKLKQRAIKLADRLGLLLLDESDHWHLQPKMP